MKIHAVRAARAVWLVPTVFLNPKGRYIYTDLQTIKDRYAFMRTPLDKKLPPEQDEGYRFENGLFESANGPLEIVHCTMHTDGIVVETRTSTDASEAFLVDFSSWAAKELALAKVEDLPISKIYSSELNFSLAKSPAFFNPALEDFFTDANKITASVGTGRSDFMQLDLATDATLNKIIQKFTLAREAGTSIDQKRYYSFASTTTQEHIALLEKLEKLAT